MKKTLYSILVVLLLFLSGCAANVEDEPHDYDPVIFEKLVFQEKSMSYTAYLDRTDIFDGLQNFEKEFFIAYSVADMKSSSISPLDDSMEQAYRLFLQKLDTLELYGYNLFTLSSGELKTFIENNGGTVSAQDIFVFNSIKDTLDMMNNYDLEISRTEYASLYTDTDISSETFDGIILIQEAIHDLDYINVSIDIEEYTYDEFILLCEEELNKVYTEEEKTTLQSAFDLLDLLYEKGEAD